MKNLFLGDFTFYFLDFTKHFRRKQSLDTNFRSRPIFVLITKLLFHHPGYCNDYGKYTNTNRLREGLDFPLMKRLGKYM